MTTLIIRLVVVCSMILPCFSSNINIKDFNLKANHDQVEVTWNFEVTDEHYVFIVEKSENAVMFSAMDTIYTQEGYENYLCMDKTPAYGLSYYRIRCTNLSGEEVTSELSYVEVSPTVLNESFEISGLYPMPFSDNVNLAILCEDNITLNIQCHDLDGKQLFEVLKPCNKGHNVFNFYEVVNLKQDTYYLTISDGYQNSKTIHFLKMDNR